MFIYGTNDLDRIKRMKWSARTIGQWVDIYMEVNGKQYKVTVELFKCSPRKLKQIIVKLKHIQ